MELGRVHIIVFFCAVCFTTVATVEQEEPHQNDDDQVCYRLLGCFSMKEPWKSILRPLPAPMSPDKINTRIYFYSKTDRNRRYEILLRPEVKLNGAPFNKTKPTIFITHGFAANGNTSWMLNMKDVYLSRVDGNVMLVDWGPGASKFNYFLVSSNTRVVGKELARLVKELNIDPKKLHFVGHSLGSHISAYAAKETPGTARITALDPAQPAFEGFHADVRLDEDDAEFVDVVHTDARPLIPFFGFGMIYPVGDVDFYMNGGFEQPGCLIPDLTKLPKLTSWLDLAKIPVEIIADVVTCAHGRSYEYFTEAIANSADCIFWGHKTSVSTFLKSVANTVTQGWVTKLTALSSTCSRDDCTSLGLRTKLSGLRGSFVVTTKGRGPYCISEAGVPSDKNSSGSSILVDNPITNGISKVVKPIFGYTRC